MSKRQGTDQGRHIAALRDRARAISIKDEVREARGTTRRAAIEAELELDDMEDEG